MKFLIIDDTSESLQTRRELSSSFPEVEVQTISTQEQFKAIIGVADFQLVITEYRLSWTDGLTLFAEIRFRYPALPVIMLTAHGSEAIAVKALKNGMLDYLVKTDLSMLKSAILHANFQADTSKIAGKSVNRSVTQGRDHALFRLTSDFAYALRVTSDASFKIEWLTEPFIQFLQNFSSTPSTSNLNIPDFGFALHPDDVQLLQTQYSKLLAGDEATTVYRVINKQGEMHCLSEHALAVRDWQSGKVTRIYGMIQDVTWRRDSEDKVRLMQYAMDSCKNGIVITGLAASDHAIIYANRAFLKMSGYTLEELLGKNCRILQQDDREQDELENFRHALTHSEDGYSIVRNYRKDGSMFWSEVYISPVRNNLNRITHFLGIQNDVTLHYEYEILLARKESKLRAIFENVDDGIIITDSKGTIQDINPAADMIFGYNADELIGNNISLLIPKLFRERHAAYLHNYEQQENTHVVMPKRQIEVLHKQGAVIPVALGVNEFYLEQQRHFVITVHDLSDNRRSEKNLRASENRYRTLFENSAEAILVYRNKDQILQANKACLNLWGASKLEDIQGKPLYELVHPDFHDTVRTRINHALLHRMVQPMHEEKIIRLDGSVADVLVSSIPFEDEQGPLLFVIIIDITERKQAEAALLESNAKYQEISKRLELIREDERTRIAREIHDELGSFLTALKIDLCHLEQQLPANLLQSKEYIQSIIQQLDDSIQTVKRIITDLRPSILDHLGLLPAIEWLVENMRKRTGIKCSLTLPKKELNITCNRSTAVFRIVQEALVNSTRHSKATELTIIVKVSRKNLLLTISDNGIGMSPELIAQPTGYGIYGMYERASHFAGQLKLTSQPNMGTTINLSIPLREDQDECCND